MSNDNHPMPVGINYEGGKIISHILKYPQCIAYANCQIAMDAPYHGRVADESHRQQGRSEINFPGYDERKLIQSLTIILSYIYEHHHNIVLIIQIARGRSGKQMFDEVLKPLLDVYDSSSAPLRYEISYGYRSSDYFRCKSNESFVFLNIGMFAVLTNPLQLDVGQLCNPVATWSITSYDAGSTSFVVDPDSFSTFHNDPKNILNQFNEIQKIKLYGIEDSMAFITPDVYSQFAIEGLVKE